ncbi:hypothetical protein BC830DRAFT_1142321 [Chytriomyces sp. MP71]|nr:hypothetical protein BC830DRAFT_1142321 [Chytriomyces sp. MP71]
MKRFRAVLQCVSRARLSRTRCSRRMGIGPPPPCTSHQQGSDAGRADGPDAVSIGPSLPPGFAASEPAAHTQTGKKRRVVGPAMAPPVTTASFFPVMDPHEDSDDDDFGPKPVPQEYAHLLENLDRERTRAEIEARIEGAASLGMQAGEGVNETLARGEWMLVPPEVKKLGAILGTEMKSRQFQRTAKEEHIDQSGWTRLPGEKGVASSSSAGGVKRKATMEGPPPPPTVPHIDTATKAAIESYNQATRPKSLMEMHTIEYAASNKFSENDASARRFDRDRDLSSRRTDGKARRDLLEGSKNLGSRFSSGGK